MPKISSTGVATTGPVASVHASEVLPDGAQVAPGTGVPVSGTEHPADGTMSLPVTGGGPETGLPAAEAAAAAPAEPESSPGSPAEVPPVTKAAPAPSPAPPAKPAAAPAAAAPAPAQPKKAANGG